MPNNVTMQAMYIQSGDPATENINPNPVVGTSAGDPYPGLMGARVTVKEPGPQGVPTTTSPAYQSKTWQRVLTDSTMTAGQAPFAGAVAWWADKTRYMVTTVPTTLGRNNVAGVFGSAVTIGNIGFIQTKGPATVKLVDAPISVPTSTSSNQIIPSATAAKADSETAGTAPIYAVMGTTLGAMNTGDNTVQVALDVPETV